MAATEITAAVAVTTALAWGLDLGNAGVALVGAVPQGLPPLTLPLEPRSLFPRKDRSHWEETPSSGAQSTLRALAGAGLKIGRIEDITPILTDTMIPPAVTPSRLVAVKDNSFARLNCYFTCYCFALFTNRSSLI